MKNFKELENGSLLSIGNYGVIRPDYEFQDNVQRFRKIQRKYIFDNLLFVKMNDDLISEYYTGIEFSRIGEVFYSSALGLFIEEYNIKHVYNSSKDVEEFIKASLVKKTGNLYNSEVDKYMDDAIDIYQDDLSTSRNQQLLLLQRGKKFTEE